MGIEKPAMVTLALRFLLIVRSIVLYLAFAILEWGGVDAFFSHPERVILMDAFFILIALAFFAGRNVSPGMRADGNNR